MKKIFYLIRKIVGLFVYMAKTKRVSKIIAQLRKKQADLRLEIKQLSKAGKPIDVQLTQILEVEKEIVNLTMEFVKIAMRKGCENEVWQK